MLNFKSLESELRDTSERKQKQKNEAQNAVDRYKQPLQ